MIAVARITCVGLFLSLKYAEAKYKSAKQTKYIRRSPTVKESVGFILAQREKFFEKSMSLPYEI